MDLKKRIQKLEQQRQPLIPIDASDIFEFEEMDVEKWNETVAKEFLESYLRTPNEPASD